MQPVIILKDVAMTVDNMTILSNISFSINPGEIVTILGPNGAGKSTLVKLVLGLIKPTKGNITRQSDLTIGYIPQKLSLDKTLPITVERFIKLNKKITDEQIKATFVQINGLHLLNKNMQQLSGGEMQRVLLAQALVKKPRLLILDEPTQGVDVNGQFLLYDLIVQARNNFGCAILMVSHDLHLVMARTDKVICINKKICCSGSPYLVSTNPNFIELFGRSNHNQLAVYHHNHAAKSKSYQGRINLPHFGQHHHD